MDVQLVRGDEVIVDGRDSGTATIRPPRHRRPSEIQATIGYSSEEVEENMDTTNEILKMMENLPDTRESTDIEITKAPINVVAEQAAKNIDKIGELFKESLTDLKNTIEYTNEVHDYDRSALEEFGYKKEDVELTTVIEEKPKVVAHGWEEMNRGIDKIAKSGGSNDSIEEYLSTSEKTSKEETTDLPREEQANNRIRPIPPTMDLY